MSNVVPLPIGWDPRVEALAEARRYQAGDFDRLLAAAAAEPATPDTTPLIDGLAAQGRAVWLRRDAEAGREQAITWAVRQEQQLGEIRELAVKWTALHDRVKRGMAQTLLDIIDGTRDDAA